MVALVSSLEVVSSYASWPLSVDMPSKHDRFGAHRGADCRPTPSRTCRLWPRETRARWRSTSHLMASQVGMLMKLWEELVQPGRLVELHILSNMAVVPSWPCYNTPGAAHSDRSGDTLISKLAGLSQDHGLLCLHRTPACEQLWPSGKREAAGEVQFSSEQPASGMSQYAFLDQMAFSARPLSLTVWAIFFNSSRDF